MIMRVLLTILLLTLPLLTLPTAAQAWDPLGHALAAHIGARLMHDRNWGNLLESRGDLLAASAGFPDTAFRAQSTALHGKETEAPAHYFHIDAAPARPSCDE